MHSAKGIVAVEPAGLQPEKAGTPGEAVFRVQSANVTTSQKIYATFFRKSAEDGIRMSVSVNNGLAWKEAWKADVTGEVAADLQLIDEVNGAYEPMLKVELLGKASASNAVLKSLSIDTTTQVNTKTLPRLNLGKNTVYVGTGDPTESIVLWPDLCADHYKEMIVEESNIASAAEHRGYFGPLHPATNGEEGFLVYRIDAPNDIVRLTYGGRFYNRTADGVRGYIRLFHSTDGKTWTPSWTLDKNDKPYDVVHYETVEIPKGVRSVWMKYALLSPNINDTGFGCSIYSLRMEANYVPPDATFQPMQVVYGWQEVQEDHSLVERSHSQVVDHVPFTYTINVGGADHPVMESLHTFLAYAVAEPKTGYSDGKDSGGEKFVYRWASAGRNLAEGKPYTVSVPSLDRWGAGDPQGVKLTDGVVGPNYAGGTAPASALLWDEGQTPEITVDLGKVQTCGAFRIHLSAGYPWWDALKGEVKDQVKLLTSVDGKEFTDQGDFTLNLRRREIPINHMLPDDETAQGFNFELAPAQPVQARYVRYKLTPARSVTVSEVQVYDWVKYEPFDIQISLPKTGS
ncbi:MAG: discoidin domain-containing protein [Candidatus Sumerlaeota bacterium]|nr:discoidin domain-containing protein [Candidatus Sumerlaeota bacterium]